MNNLISKREEEEKRLRAMEFAIIAWKNISQML